MISNTLYRRVAFFTVFLFLRPAHIFIQSYKQSTRALFQGHIPYHVSGKAGETIRNTAPVHFRIDIWSFHVVGFVTSQLSFIVNKSRQSADISFAVDMRAASFLRYS